MEKKIIFSKEEKEMIRQKFFPPKTSDTDFYVGITLAEQLGLNPFMREIMYVARAYKDKVTNTWVTSVQPLVGRDGFLSIAHKTGNFDGMETTVEVKPISFLEKGEWVEKKDLVATCKVYCKDKKHPVVSEVCYSEYVQLDKTGKPTSFWKDKPRTMLGKVAESQALRKAFNISGVYAPEEINDDDMEEFIPQQEEEELETKENKKQEKNPTPKPQEEEKDKDLESTLKSVGCFIKEQDGVLVVEGKTYNNKNILKKLGFTWDSSMRKWVKPKKVA